MTSKLSLFLCVVVTFMLISCEQEMRKERVVGSVKKGDDVVYARINGIPITKSDYEREEKKLPQNLRELLKDSSKKKQFIDNLITKSLLYQEAKRLGLENTQGVKQAVESFERDVIINALIESKIKNSINITEDEAYNFYIKNSNKYYSPDLMTYEQFIFRDYTAASIFQSKSILPKNSSEYIVEKVEDKKLDTLDIRVANQLKNLKKGEYSQNIILLENGYYVFKLLNRVKGEILPFEKVKGEIFEELKKGKEKDLLKEYVDSLKELSKIDVLVNFDNDSTK